MEKKNNTIKFGVPGFFGCSGVPVKSVPVFQSVPMFRSVPVFRCSGVPVFRCSGVPVFQCSSVPVFLVFVHSSKWRYYGKKTISLSWGVFNTKRRNDKMVLKMRGKA